MFPMPASVRWSRSAALIGARRPTSRSASRAGEKARSRGSAPSRLSRYGPTSGGSTTTQVPKRRTSRYVTSDPSSNLTTARLCASSSSPRRLVGELECRENGLVRLGRGGVVPCVDLGERLALGHGVAPFPAADDADRVVDRVLLGAPSRTEAERRDPDRERSESRDVPAARSEHLVDDRC